MFQVKDGRRTLKFEGEVLAQSSSWRPGSFRWIEFRLYRTEGGTYVLSRVGVSLIFHTAACPLVKRYGLQESDPDTLDESATPCPECRPTFSVPMVFPEKHRFWAAQFTEADAVVRALYKYDDDDSPYFTNVARRLLEDASEADDDIDEAYHFETIL